jgi:mRNA-degrading endonuclease RelE of RelBE toxin-antitoxin system
MNKLSPANQAKLRRLPRETQEMILEAAIEEEQIKIESRVKRGKPVKLSELCE